MSNLPLSVLVERLRAARNGILDLPMSDEAWAQIDGVLAKVDAAHAQAADRLSSMEGELAEAKALIAGMESGNLPFVLGRNEALETSLATLRAQRDEAVGGLERAAATISAFAECQTELNYRALVEAETQARSIIVRIKGLEKEA